MMAAEIQCYKCKVMHTGRNNLKYFNKSGTNLGIIAESAIKISAQCTAMVKNRNEMLDCIKNGR